MEAPSIRIATMSQPHITGLGIQQWEWCRHMHPAKVLITDLSKLHAENSRNQKQVTKTDWFDRYERMTVEGIPDEQACRWLLEDVDVLYVHETPLNWSIFRWAREMRVKTVLGVNPEFFEYNVRDVPKPDLFLAPTKWHIDSIARYGKVICLPVPIATDRIQRREITAANEFLHITGFKAHLDRNGTEIIQRAMMFSEVEVIVHDQSKKELDNYWDLYTRGDVLVLPRRYGGLSLQLQEAAAAGMPIIVSEKDPYASEACTVAIPGPYTHVRVKLKGDIDCYSADPRSLAHVINELNGTDISQLSNSAYYWAMERSWSEMKEQYQNVLEELCQS